jgi:hypothetical protein
MLAAIAAVADDLPPPPHAVAKPWAIDPPPLLGCVSETVRFASDDTSVGSVSFAWRGPPLSELEDYIALEVLLRWGGVIGEEIDLTGILMTTHRRRFSANT